MVWWAESRRIIYVWVNPGILFERVRKHTCYASGNTYLPLEYALTSRSFSRRDKVWLKHGFTRQPFHTTSISFTTLTGCAEWTVIKWEVDLINTIQTPNHLATDDTIFFDVVYTFQITDLQQNETILEKDSCIISFSLESFYEDISLYSKMDKIG